ncbi:MAG TPA: hypothetical protein VHI93_06710 [Candidatus Thermoplasmatota archaeon]|nr:hypothetical protein [Candidatus Thermoplasmatota archaeon]
MNVPWGLIVIVIGFAYGAMKAGRQDKSRLFLRGLLIGVVVAVVLVLLSALTKVPVLQIAGVAGAVGIVVTAIVLSLLFILGVWLGDLVTGARRRRVA